MEERAKAAAWFYDKFELDGDVDIEESGRINVTGSCRLRSDVPLERIAHKFGVVTGNFSLRGASLISLEKIPAEVRGTAIFPWTDKLGLLNLVVFKGDFLVFNDEKNHPEIDVAGILRRHQRDGSIATKHAVLLAQKDLIANRYSKNAYWS